MNNRYYKVSQVKQDASCNQYLQCYVIDTLTNTVLDCNDPLVSGLTTGVGKSGSVIITSGQTWSPSTDVISYTYRVEGTATDMNVDTYNNGGTFLDSFGVTTPIADGEVKTFPFESCSSDGLPVITAGNKHITITYTTI